MLHIGRRDDVIAITSRNETGASAYNDDGFLIAPTEATTTTIEVWGNVEELESRFEVIGNKRHRIRVLKIEVDAIDVENVSIQDTLQVVGETDTYAIVDLYESEFRFTTEIIAEYTR